MKAVTSNDIIIRVELKIFNIKSNVLIEVKNKIDNKYGFDYWAVGYEKEDKEDKNNKYLAGSGILIYKGFEKVNPEDIIYEICKDIWSITGYCDINLGFSILNNNSKIFNCYGKEKFEEIFGVTNES